MAFKLNTENGVWKYKTSKKEKAFEYFVSSIIKWWMDANKDKDFSLNNLSILKVMKLLFFTVSASSDSNNDGLLNVFDNWYAQPYGHVEKDIDELIRFRKGVFSFFTITNSGIVLHER